MRLTKSKFLAIGKLTLLGGVPLVTAGAAVMATISCSVGDDAFIIRIDDFEKYTPAHKAAIKLVEKQLADMGVTKFKFAYTDQKTQNYTTEKLTQLGYSDRSMPDIFRLEFSELSKFNNEKQIMPFTDKWVHDLKLKPGNGVSDQDFKDQWYGDGISAAVSRYRADRLGNVSSTQLDVVGLPYSFSSAVIAVRNGMKLPVGTSKLEVTPSNVNNPATIAYLKTLTKERDAKAVDVSASSFTDRESTDIPNKLSTQLEIMKRNVANKEPLWFHDRRDIYANDLLQLLSSAIKNDGGVIGSQEYNTNNPTDAEKEKAVRQLYFWEDKSDKGRRWKNLYDDRDNSGAAKVWKGQWDALTTMFDQDKKWTDPATFWDSFFKVLSDGSRMIPIGGAWDIKMAELKYSEFWLGAKTDDEVKQIYANANPEARKELERIRNDSTTFLPVKDIIGYNNIPMTAFLQPQVLSVNARNGLNSAYVNASVTDKNGNTVTRQDVIGMYLKAFTSPDIMDAVASTNQISPMNKQLRDKFILDKTASVQTETASGVASTVMGENPSSDNMLDFMKAQSETLTSGVAGPIPQFQGSVQGSAQNSLEDDIRFTYAKSNSEIASGLSAQINAGIDKKAILDKELGAGNYDDRFRYFYNTLISKIDKLVDTTASLGDGTFI